MQELLTYINSNTFIGIPLDIIAHFFVGMIFIVLGLLLNIKFSHLLFGLFVLTSVKEIRDILYYSSPLLENIKDYFFSFLYALILIPVRIKLKGSDWKN